MTEIKASSVMGNRQSLDGGAMFGNVPRTLWEQWVKPDEGGRIELATKGLLLEFCPQSGAPPLRVLLEAGIGTYMSPKLKARFGVIEDRPILLESLSDLGLSPLDIDIVILSHLHFDHAGGILTGYDPHRPSSLVFDKARYVVSREAFLRSKCPHPRDQASFIPQLGELLEKSGKLTLIERDERLPSFLPKELSFRFTDGHTPGQMHTICQGGDRKLIFLGDLVPGAPWVHLPVTMGYDRFAEKVIDEKKEMYRLMMKDQIYGFFVHDPAIAMAQVTEQNGRVVVQNPIYELKRWQL